MIFVLAFGSHKFSELGVAYELDVECSSNERTTERFICKLVNDCWTEEEENGSIESTEVGQTCDYLCYDCLMEVDPRIGVAPIHLYETFE